MYWDLQLNWACVHCKQVCITFCLQLNLVDNILMMKDLFIPIKSVSLCSITDLFLDLIQA